MPDTDRALKPLVISGPSGVGKTTVCDRVVCDPRFRLSVSATTRAPRPGEVEGREYHFLSEADFRARIAEGGFLEWAWVYGNLYGTPRAPIEAMLAAGICPVLNIDTQGARLLRERGEDGRFVFLVPPSLEVLEARLRNRKTDSPAVIERRLARARAEIAEAPRYDRIVKNDDLDRAAAETRAFALGELEETGDDAG